MLCSFSDVVGRNEKTRDQRILIMGSIVVNIVVIEVVIEKSEFVLHNLYYIIMRRAIY